jgi:hypothetical protein
MSSLPLTLPNPISPPSDNQLLINLQSQVAKLLGRVGVLEGKVGVLEGKVNVLMDTTLPGLLVTLHCVLDAHLLTLGFDSNNPSLSHSTFITENKAVIASALGIPISQVSQYFQYLFSFFLS